MTLDVVALRAFYDSPLGETARRFVGRALADFLAPVAGASVMGIGYPGPYLEAARGRAERVLAFMPAAQGVEPWPRDVRPAACLADSLMLPLPDGCMDRVLIVHALESSEDPDELFYEVWRVLAPGGRLAVVAPNRGGLWARMDVTPFGHGQPFSRGQLKALMRRTLFTPESWTETLYVPPLASPMLRGSAGAFERIGTRLNLPFAGLHVVEATKQLHRPLMVRQTRRGTRFIPVLVPQANGAATSRWAAQRRLSSARSSR
ncbi:class I SAM-dependent methyltransferase [Salinarimonas ramus]|uniref:Methyltransferase type 11 n=1 Tax=Salinarimonas ramus TaxID=690164 RepID=A0A917QC57_9HYPH|nr:class I SAM-dependent methyltransferase [Salinarimonas ramus]GGK42216.1 methyltransferase type 11 [Salinarimonas ramus]